MTRRVAFVALGLLATAASAQSPAPPPPLDGHPGLKSIHHAETEACPGGRRSSVTLVQAAAGRAPQVTYYWSSERYMGARDLARWNARLGEFGGLSAVSARCAPGGEVVTIEGPPAAGSPPGTLWLDARVSGRRLVSFRSGGSVRAATGP